MFRRRLVKGKVVAAIRSELMRGSNRELHRMKRTMALRLIELIKDAYMVKARGGRDIAGLEWRPTKAFAKKLRLILYRSGKLFRGFKFRMTEAGFEIYNDIAYSEFAFKHRPPWGDKLPDEWVAEMAEVARPFLSEIVSRAIRNKFSRSVVTAH